MRVRHLAEDQTEYLKKWLNTRLLLQGALPLRAETDRIDNRRSAWLTVKALLRPTHLNALFLRSCTKIPSGLRAATKALVGVSQTHPYL